MNHVSPEALITGRLIPSRTYPYVVICTKVLQIQRKYVLK